MNKINKANKKAIFAVYAVLDIICVGMGMGVPFFCIILGIPVGWYITKKLIKTNQNTAVILSKSLKYAFYSSIFTFILMIIIWGPYTSMLWVHGTNFVNFGMPLILYDPKISFIGWIILMIFISPFLQLLMTVFTSNVTLWRLYKRKNLLNEKFQKISEGEAL